MFTNTVRPSSGGGSVTSAAVAAAIEVTVASIADPAAELALLGTAVPQWAVCKTVAAGTDEATWYRLDATSDATDSPYVVASLTAGLKWVAIAGRYIAGSLVVRGGVDSESSVVALSQVASSNPADTTRIQLHHNSATGGYAASLSPVPVLTADRQYLLPNADITVAGTAGSGALTSGRVPYATAGGLLTDNANLTYNSATALNIANTTSSTSATTGSLTIGNGTAATNVGIGGGNVTAGALITGANLRSGTGSPEGVVTAPVGTVFERTDGGTGTTLYIKETGAGNTGWVAVAASGTGTVTSVSVTTANGVSGSVATATTTPAISLTLGAITPSSVASSGAVTGTNLRSGTGTPEGAVTAAVGSLFERTDGSTGTTLYIKETGAGNTGWVPVVAGSVISGLTDNRITTANGTTAIDSPVAIDSDQSVILRGGGGIARSDAALEIINKTNSPASHALLSIFQDETPGTTGPFDEGAISFGLRNDAGTIRQGASISSMWCSSAAAATGYAMLRFNIANAIAGGDIQLRLYCKNGASWFATDDSSTYAPGDKTVRNYGRYIGSLGILDGSMIRSEGATRPTGAAGNGIEMYWVSGDNAGWVRVTNVDGTLKVLGLKASRVVITDGDLQVDWNITLRTAGKGLEIKEGSDARMGIATLSGGTVVVSTTQATANSRIFLTSNVPGGTPGWVRVSARSAGTSFTILSSSGTDTSQIAWMIVEPSP